MFSVSTMHICQHLLSRCNYRWTKLILSV
jgi:hypothetical protein